MLFKKKNQHEQAEAPPMASMPASPGNQKQSLFAPGLNLNPARIDFGFGQTQDPPPYTPATVVEPSPPPELQATGWAPGTPEVQTSGWSSSPPPEPMGEPFPTGDGWASTTPAPIESASMPMPTMEPLPGPAWPTSEADTLPGIPPMQWEDPPQPLPEPSQPYLTETFDNYTAPAAFEPSVQELPTWEPAPMEFSETDPMTQPISTSYEPLPFNDFQLDNAQTDDLQAEWNAPSSHSTFEAPMADPVFMESPSLEAFNPDPMGMQAVAPMELSFPTAEPYMQETPTLESAEHSLWNNLNIPESSPPGGQMPINPAAFLDSVSEQLYPQDPFSSVDSDLEESAQAFEEAAQFLFPETMGAPLDWSADNADDAFDQSSLLGGETLFEPALELGPSFQNETAGFDDISVFDDEANQFDSFATPESTTGYMETPVQPLPTEPSYHLPPVEQPLSFHPEPTPSTFESGNSDDMPTIQLDNAIGSTAAYDAGLHSAGIYTPETAGEPAWNSEENGLTFDSDEEFTNSLDLTSNLASTNVYNASGHPETGFAAEPNTTIDDFLGAPPLESYTPPPPPDPALEFGTSFEGELGGELPAGEIPAYEIPAQPIATWDDSLLGDSPMMAEPLENVSQPAAGAEFNPSDTWLAEDPLTEPETPTLSLSPNPMPLPQETAWQASPEIPTAPMAESVAPSDDDFYAVSFTLNEQGELVPDHGGEPAPPSIEDSYNPQPQVEIPTWQEPVAMEPQVSFMPDAQEADFYSQSTTAAEDINFLPPVQEEAFPSTELAPPMEAAQAYNTAPVSPIETMAPPPIEEESISAFEFMHEPEAEEEQVPAYSLAPPAADHSPTTAESWAPPEPEPFFMEEEAIQPLAAPETALLPPVPPIPAMPPVMEPATMGAPQETIAPPNQPERIPVAAQTAPSRVMRKHEPPQTPSSNLAEQWEKPHQLESQPLPKKPPQPQASELMLGKLEILSICPLDAERRLLIIHNGGVFALMGQSGVEQPEISVLKVFENNPIAYQNTFTAVAEGQAGNQGMYVVQVGTWHAIISTFQTKITLHTELG